MNNIILVDDDQKFIDSFVNEAAANSISVSAKNSLDGMKGLLPAFGHKYAAIVLDIKCLLQDDQAKEASSFIGAALRHLDTTMPSFPRFILTGDDSEFDKLKNFYPDEKMFLKKTEDQEKLFIELKFCIQNAEPLRIKRDNSTVFEAFDNRLLNPAKEIVLLNIIRNYNEVNANNFRGIIGDIRELHEEVYKSLNKRNATVVPNSYLNGNGSPSFTRSFYDHLGGNPNPKNKYTPTTTVYQDSTILGITQFIHHACSEFLHGSSKAKYQISHYTIKALINSLLELIIWSKQY